MPDDPRLEIGKVFLAEAAEMVAARDKCRIIHGTSDIDASGDEVEMCARNLLKGRLGANYYVGHGHVCDRTWKASPQFDIIVSDNALFTSLFRGMNGTEYFPYETVYGVGEVKATYYQSKQPIQKFIAACDELQTLNRAPVPANFVRAHTDGIVLQPPLTWDYALPKKNHLFKFLLFVDAGDFDIDDVKEIYNATPLDKLPNVVCFLNRGLIARITVTFDASGAGTPAFLVHPELRPVPIQGQQLAWSLFCEQKNELAHSWAWLYTLIVAHLCACTVRPVSPLDYMSTLATTNDNHKFDLVTSLRG